MRVGIVGSESAKFTTKGKRDAMELIRSILAPKGLVDLVISGGCHLGGIDQWAIEIAQELQLPYKEYKPRGLSWVYYKERNLLIASESDIVYCITVDTLPEFYTGMRFERCHHCDTDTHVKSGGCWTMHQATTRGKKGVLYVVNNL